MIRISVITICFNSSSTIEETILSVINQDYKNLEYIIIDGCSTDGTIEIINKYIDKITYFKSEPDKGISDAFNKGIKVATGEYIVMINSDDILYKEALENINSFVVKNPNIDIIYGDWIAFESADSIGRLKYACAELSNIEYDFPVCHQSMYIKKDAYEKYGYYDLKLKNTMDHALVSKMIFEGASIKYTQNILSCFRNGGITETQFRNMLLERKIIAKHNGVKPKTYNSYFIKELIKSYLIFIMKKIGIFNIIRDKLKPTEELYVKWWE